jgi:hypothetical protein
MSFATALGNFEEIVNNLKDQSSSTNMLLNFLRSISEAYQQFYKNLKSSLACINPQLLKCDYSDSLYSSLDVLRENITLLSEQISKMYKSIREEAISPIEKNLKDFNYLNNAIVQQNAWLFKEYKRTLLLIEKHRQQYYRLSESYTASLDTKSVKQDSKKVEAENTNYKRNVKKLKYWKEKYSAKLLEVMKQLEDNEEKRRSIIKESLTAFQQQSDLFYSTMIKHQPSMRFQEIEPQSDIKLIVDAIKAKSINESTEEYISYQDYLRAISETDSKIESKDSIDNISFDKPDIVKRSSILNSIFLEDESSKSAMDKLNGSLESFYRSFDTSEGRWMFCMMLENREKHDKLTMWNLEYLGGFIYHLLNSMVAAGDKDPEVFYKLILVCHRFYAYNEKGRRVYLISMIWNHTIWKEQDRWTAALRLLLSSKLKSDKNRQLHRRSKTSYAGLMISKEYFNNQISSDRKENITARLLSMVRQYYINMLNFNIPSAIALEVISEAFLDIGLPVEIIEEFRDSCASISKISISKLERDAARWSRYLALKYVLYYLEEFDLDNLLLISKEWNSILTKPVSHIKYKLHSHTQDIKIRQKYWASALNVKSVTINYAEVLKKMSEFPDLMLNHVERSFHSYSSQIQQALKNILNAYAVYNPEIGYCQGMNYIAGTLYLGVNDEEIAFKGMISLLERYSMMHIYQLHHQILNMKFYQLERLISLFLPEMSQYMREHEVHSFKYSSSWFITIFSQTLKYEEELRSRLWDMFLLDGWKAFFKIAIGIFAKLSTKFHEKNFDEIMSVISNISSREVNQDIFTEDFIDQARSIKITTSLLKYLEDEYLAHPKKEYIKEII